MDEEIKKCCENCGNYFQHYGWTAEKFRPIECGHCLKFKITKKKHISYPNREKCDFWQTKEEKIAIREKRLKDDLTQMATYINDIIILIENGYLDL